MGQKYLKIEDQMPGLVREQDVAKRGGLEPKANVFKTCFKFYCRGAVKKQLLLKRITNRSLGAGPPAAGGYGRFFFEFFLIFGKNRYFNVIWITKII